MQPPVKIGTRDSELAVWQAIQVQKLLNENDIPTELVYIKSEGDINTVTPLYELGVQGIFTRTLDAALLNHRIDIAVHSMKDVPTQLANGIHQAAVLKRGSHKDIIVYKNDRSFLDDNEGNAIIATSSIRRKAQWLYRYPKHTFENLRGNINTRLRKVSGHNWNGAIFAAAGLERINLRPQNSADLDWMLPAPAQGAIIIVCRKDDDHAFICCNTFNDEPSALCTAIERDFLRELGGGCSTPISALAVIKHDKIIFRGNICSPDGKAKIDIEREISICQCHHSGIAVAQELLQNAAAKDIISSIKNDKQ